MAVIGLVLLIELFAYALICIASFEASKGVGMLVTGLVLLWICGRIAEVIEKLGKDEKE